MNPILCPRCRIRVLPSPEGICPGCRQVNIVPAATLQVAATKECPECQAPLAENAVLCVACGYHLQREGFLSTAVERRPSFRDEELAAAPPEIFQPRDMNPYASPAILNEHPVMPNFRDDLFVADLTPYAAKKAAAIVADAGRVYWVIFLSLCICRIGWLIMGPWYAYRLYSWYQLNRTFSELRNPTPRISAHYSLALDFQAVKGRLWAGAIVGGIAFLLILWVALLAMLDEHLR